MKLSAALAVTPLLTATCSARSILRKPEESSASVEQLSILKDQSFGHGQQVLEDHEEKFLIEINPGETRWVSEDQKWELRRAGQNFMDITDNGDLFPALNLAYSPSVSKSTFPSKPAYNSTIRSLSSDLSKDSMHKNLAHFTSFHTRYYKSASGAQSSDWLYEQVKSVVDDSGAVKHANATVTKFSHPWGQNSIIAQIPGQSNKTVVIGAHQDSINLFLPSFLAAPGADDDGSGTVTILEALRVLLQNDTISRGQATNTVEFQWYSAEEGGLLGSQAIFKEYSATDRDVRAMLQQDMTGYTQKTLDAGKPESVGVITDFVDEDLTEFIRMTVDNYCDIPYTETKCGYACSDHASASKYGYPSAFVIESDFADSDDKIHTTEDKIQYLSFDHMLQHAKMTLAFAFELSMAEL